MKSILIGIACLSVGFIQALDYEVQLDNESMRIARVKVGAKEEIPLHYDVYPSVVVAVQGGILTRLEADGSETEVEFSTGKATVRPAETKDKAHKTVNNTDSEVELVIIQFKDRV